jgi:hypothetical protein
VAFLEGGVWWAPPLFTSILGHWQKRNINNIGYYDPRNLDLGLFSELLDQYGGSLAQAPRGDNSIIAGRPVDRARLDDFEACRISSSEEVASRFIPNFYFGCEADDPTTSSAFATQLNPFGVRFNAIFSSDLGHWDVPDMEKILLEAYESVEHGWMTEDDLRRFVFDHPVRFYTDTNPDFFAGTPIAGEVQRFLATEADISSEH